MRLLLDTQLLVWIALGDTRISRPATDAIQSPDNQLFVSATVAFEFTDLQIRRRFPVHDPIGLLAAVIGFDIVDFPAGAWHIAPTLPDIHRDPVDRMLVAHALSENYVLVTADATIRGYPVESIW